MPNGDAQRTHAPAWLAGLACRGEVEILRPLGEPAYARERLAALQGDDR